MSAKRHPQATPPACELDYLILAFNSFFPLTPVVRASQPPPAYDRPAAPFREHRPRTLPEGAALHDARRPA